MRLRIMAAVAALALVNTPAAAQSSMTSFSFAEMRALLAEIKAEVIRDGVSEDGTRFLEAKAESGMLFGVYGMECDTKEPTQRCTGAELLASFTLKPGMMERALEETDYAAIADYAGAQNKLKISRYVIFDGGISRENLRVNVKVFLDIGDQVWEDLTDKKMLE